MSRAIRHLTLMIAVVALLPVPASFASGAEVRQDCGEDDSLDGKYTRAELQDGLNNLGGDLDEYSNCRAAINAALQALSASASGSRNDGSSSGGSRTPAERAREIAHNREAREEAKERRELNAIAAGLDPAKPATIKAASAGNGLPLSLLLVLFGLASLAIAGTVFAARRNPALAKALRSVSPTKLRR